jgi:hypothetical protein
LDEQLRESRVIKVAGRAIAIWQNPFRVLRAERIVHLPLKRHIRRSFNGETEKTRRVRHLAPDVLALWNRIEDPIPTAVRIKDRHVQHQHRVVATPTRAKPPSRFLLIHFSLVHDVSFRNARTKTPSAHNKAPMIGLRITNHSAPIFIADGLRFCMHCDYFLSLGCSRLIANSTSTNAHKIDIVIMNPLNRPHSR